MDIFVYSDESGVFDNKHNDIYVFAGVIFFGKEQKDIAVRKYLNAERCIRKDKYTLDAELKASYITVKERSKLYRSLNNVYKFCTVIKQAKVNTNIFDEKKSKQRFLDYAYKIMIKRYLEFAMENDYFKKDELLAIHFFVDQHTTATDGVYELREGIEEELRFGTFNYNYNYFFPPLFNKNILKTIDLKFCDSKKTPLVRAADIVANRVYYNAKHSINAAISDRNLHGIIQP